MTRRDLLRLTGSSLLYSALSPLMGLAAGHRPSGGKFLFYHPSDLPMVRSNARTPLLQPLYAAWAAKPPTVLKESLDRFAATGNLVFEFQTATQTLEQACLVQLIEPTPARQAAILDFLDRLIALPYWDYFRDGPDDVIGIQRASFATVRVLFAREVLGEAISPEFDKRLLAGMAEKGCLPCYRTVYDMDNPDQVTGWQFDKEHHGFYDITMERWPMILGANNLRPAPASALGLGALALLGHDPRAENWLATAVASTKRFLKLFTPDGSYFEGLSYLSYCLRTALPFMLAHKRLVGDVDWLAQVNFDGMLDYIMTLQLGKRPDGLPDIVNFSDAHDSVFPGAISAIGELTGNPLAGYAAKEAGHPTWFYDFLWYRPEAPAKAPRPALLNMRNDLNWIVCRSGWAPEDTVVAFKSGGPANHEHADRNQIILKSNGERLLTDQFGAAYDRRHEGWLMRQTRAHNAILVNGEGHPYIDGVEGTNDSQAYATLLQYEDHGERVWWTSDASAAYILNNYHMVQVLRTVLFAKPDILVVLDQIRLRYIPQTVDARYFPDNRDGLARLSADGSRFVITRPKASLHGLVASDTGAASRLSRLEVSDKTGDFPCVEVHSPEALSHSIVTLLACDRGAGAPVLSARREGPIWNIEAGSLRAAIKTSQHEPEIFIL